MGYNDMPLVDLVEPPLTTVRVPAAGMSRVAAQLLLDLLDGNREAARHIVLAAQPVVRASTLPFAGARA